MPGSSVLIETFGERGRGVADRSQALHRLDTVRKPVLMVSVVLLFACGGGVLSQLETTLPPRDGGGEVTAHGGPNQTTPGTPAEAETTTTTSGRPTAPDFTLELGGGGTFTLSEQDKPVFVVFWAEWCSNCRREMPAIDALAAEYGDRVAFVAPAWHGSLADTTQRAGEWMPSGVIAWGLDEDEEIFALYGVPYQPEARLIGADGTLVDGWAGVRGEEQLRAAIENLLAVAG